MIKLEYLTQTEKDFLKSLGNSPETDSYKDWKNKERKLNEIYTFIMNEGRTLKHTQTGSEGYIHPSTTNQNHYQFTIFNASDKYPTGHFTNDTLELLARNLLDKGYDITHQPEILY